MSQGNGNHGQSLKIRNERLETNGLICALAESVRMKDLCETTFYSRDKRQHSVKCPYSEFFWSIFSCIWTESGEIRNISPYSLRMRENTDQKNSKYGHFTQYKTS